MVNKGQIHTKLREIFYDLFEFDQIGWLIDYRK